MGLAKLGVGVLGVGEMGKRHAENLRRLVPEARLVAIADVAQERARQTAAELEIDQFFTSLEDMLACKEIDAVLIATPDKFHARAVESAAAAGKDILCEKPLATNRSDALRALKAVQTARVRLQVGFMRRYDPAYAAAMKRVENGEIGEPVIFKSLGRDRDVPPLSAYQSNINGMLFYTNTIHDFDLARWMMRDEVTEVQAYSTVSIRPELAQYGDVVASVVNLKFGHGAIGNIDSYAQALYAYDVRTEIVGSKGSIFIGSIEKTPATFLSPAGGTTILADHFLSRFADAYLNEIGDFVHNMLHDQPPRVTGDDGMRALEIAIAAEESHSQHVPRAVVTEGLESLDPIGAAPRA
ncbi:MAG TPA: Gfo/Idh/MocA family oxidoreductase [Candidatus Sulfotelmatobacter sp.]|nr:Gfo/Idh/MocA family oxidoreductase [Candidatus Sulfotelmatobacter sp.]